MSQNTSHAVMAQRKEARDSLDLFPTPPWATRALCEWIELNECRLGKMSAWEPAAGFGDMARPLAEYFATVHASDVYQHGGAQEVVDFLWPTDRRADWIITNPPFRLAQQFAETAISRAKRGVALLVRTAFLEGGARYAQLFSKRPPSDILQFVERVPMVAGRLTKDATTATAYCWLMWRRPSFTTTHFHWLAPCRKRLELASDYSPSEAAQ